MSGGWLTQACMQMQPLGERILVKPIEESGVSPCCATLHEHKLRVLESAQALLGMVHLAPSMCMPESRLAHLPMVI